MTVLARRRIDDDDLYDADGNGPYRQEFSGPKGHCRRRQRSRAARVDRRSA